MIQRFQSIWLLLAAAAGFLTLEFPFYSGTHLGGLYLELTAKENLPILILTVATAVLALVTIFLYKNRKLQLKMTLAGIVVSIITLVLYFNTSKEFIQGNFSIWAVFSFIVPLALILAARRIYMDEKLIKSLDRLR